MSSDKPAQGEARGRTPRSVAVADHLWDALDLMAREMGIDRDALVNQAIFNFARLNGYMTPGRVAASTADDRSVAHAGGVPTAADAPSGGRDVAYVRDVSQPRRGASRPAQSRATESARESVPEEREEPPAEEEAPHEPEASDELPEEGQAAGGDEEEPEGAAEDERLPDPDAAEEGEPPPDEEPEQDRSGELPEQEEEGEEPSAERTPLQAAKKVKEGPKDLFVVAGTRSPIKVKNERFLIGRGKHCDLVIESNRVSREHAVIFREGGEMLIEDLKSSNGTWFNKERITKRPIADGDEYVLGTERVKCSFKPAGR